MDPMAGKYFSSTPYSYVDGNPIIRNDPNGEDWFRNQNGIMEWRDVRGNIGEITSFKDSKGTWVNLGAELLVFTGDAIIYYTQSLDDNGNLTLNSQTFDAVSGKPLEEINTPNAPPPFGGFEDYISEFTFDYSKNRQKIKDQGPTPEGLYSINKSDFKESSNESGVQKWNDQSSWNKTKSKVGLGTWPGGINSWGNHRWQLAVEDAKTYGRKNMYLHGGTKWGSRGCIDIGNNIGTLANAILTNKTGNDKVYLKVCYPHDMKFKVANGTTNHLQKIQ